MEKRLGFIFRAAFDRDLRATLCIAFRLAPCVQGALGKLLNGFAQRVDQREKGRRIRSARGPCLRGSRRNAGHGCQAVFQHSLGRKVFQLQIVSAGKLDRLARNEADDLASHNAVAAQRGFALDRLEDDVQRRHLKIGQLIETWARPRCFISTPMALTWGSPPLEERIARAISFATDT